MAVINNTFNVKGVEFLTHLFFMHTACNPVHLVCVLRWVRCRQSGRTDHANFACLRWKAFSVFCFGFFSLKSIMQLWTAFMLHDNLKRQQYSNLHVVCNSGSKTRRWWLPGVSRCLKVWLTRWLFHWFPRGCSWLLQSSQFTAPEQVVDLWFPPLWCFRTLLRNEMFSSFVGSCLACNFLLSPDFYSDSFFWRLLLLQLGFLNQKWRLMCHRWLAVL